MIRGGVHVEGIRAREVLLLPQTLKYRRQLAHKLLRYTTNEKFRNAATFPCVGGPFSLAFARRRGGRPEPSTDLTREKGSTDRGSVR